MILKFLLFIITILIDGYQFVLIDPDDFQMPIPRFYAFQHGGMNITIPDQEGIRQFSIYASVNREYRGTNETNDIIQTTNEKWNDQWVIHVKDRQFELDDGIYYMYFIRYENVGFIKHDQRWDIDAIYDDKGNIVEGKIVEDDLNCPLSPTRHLGKNPCLGKLIFSDEFDGDKLAGKRWQIETYIAEKPDFEFVTYNADNVFIKDNTLLMKPTIIEDEDYIRRGIIDFGQDCTKRINSSECKMIARGTRTLPPINSSRVISSPHFTFHYGKIEFYAKLPEGDWIYPELFLIRKSDDYQQNSKQIQRILMGFVAGNEVLKYNGEDIGCNRLQFGYLKSSLNVIDEIVPLNYDRKLFRNDECWNKDFHTFTIVWEPDRIEFKVDGQSFGSLNVRTQLNSSHVTAEDEFYLAFGVGVGGNTFFSDGSITSDNNYVKPWQNRHPKARIEFWKHQDVWESTWRTCSTKKIVPRKGREKSGDEDIDDSVNEIRCPTALQIKYVKVWAL